MAHSGSASRLIAKVGETGTGGEVVDLSPYLSNWTASFEANTTTSPALGRGHELSVVLQSRWNVNATGSTDDLHIAQHLGKAAGPVLGCWGYGVHETNYGLQNGDLCFLGNAIVSQNNLSAPYADLFTFDAVFTGTGQPRQGAIMYTHQNATRTSFTGYTNIAEAARLRLVGKKVQMFVWTDTISNRWTLAAQTDGGNLANLSVSGSESRSLKFSAVSASALPATKVLATQGVRFTWRATATNARWAGIIGVLEAE